MALACAAADQNPYPPQRPAAVQPCSDSRNTYGSIGSPIHDPRTRSIPPFKIAVFPWLRWRWLHSKVADPPATQRGAADEPHGLKSSFHRASFHDPEINHGYGLLIAHDGRGGRRHGPVTSGPLGKGLSGDDRDIRAKRLVLPYTVVCYPHCYPG